MWVLFCFYSRLPCKTGFFFKLLHFFILNVVVINDLLVMLI